MSRVFIVLGDSTGVALDVARVGSDLFDLPDYTLELSEGNFSARSEIGKFWIPPSLIAGDPVDGRRRKVVCDAISCGVVDGWRTLVSQSAKDKLEGELRRDCEFLPVEVSGLREPYYALYVTRLLDALDEDASEFSEPVPYLGNRRRIQREEFLEGVIGDAYLFRLPGWKYAPDRLYDYATQRFLDLVVKNEVSGFQFFENLLDGAKRIVPVECERK